MRRFLTFLVLFIALVVTAQTLYASPILIESWTEVGGRAIYFADNSEPMLLAEGDSGDFSPDGTKVVYQLINYNLGIVEVANPANVRQLTNFAWEEGVPWGPKWSPDGSKIAFNVNVYPFDSYEVWVINADGTGLRRLADDFNDSLLEAWFGDQFLIVNTYSYTCSAPHVCSNHRRDLRIVDIETNDWSLVLTNTPLDSELNVVVSTTWGIAFEVPYFEDTDDPAIMSVIPGYEPVLIVDHADSPSWSPDGTQLVYRQLDVYEESHSSEGPFYERSTSEGIFIVDVGTGDSRLLYSEEGKIYSQPQWRDERIFFTVRDLVSYDDAAIYSILPDGTDLQVEVSGRIYNSFRAF